MLVINLKNYDAFYKKSEIKNNWPLLVPRMLQGRLAAYISKVLRGKSKSTFNPHIDNGDFVIVTNIDKIKFSGNKFEEKYFRHTGHPGGIKEITPSQLKDKNKAPGIKIGS